MEAKEDEIPITTCTAENIQKTFTKKPFLVLLDSGAHGSWWNAKSLPKGCSPKRVESVQSSTLAGTMESNLAVTVENITFPEFFRTRKLMEVEARVFHTPCRYDAILGREVLKEMGIILNFKNGTMKWDESIVPMKQYPSKAAETEPSFAEQLFLNALEADLEDDDTLPTCDMTDDEEEDFPNDEEFSERGNDHAMDKDLYPSSINVSKYETADINLVVRSCTHLSQEQQNQLEEVLSRYPTLFNNKLGTYPDETIHLDLNDDAVPHCQPRAYSVPHNHRPIFKAELDRLVKIGVLEPAPRSEWIAGTFIIAKKLLPNETVPRVRWISDFRGLNKHLKRKVYPIPRIADILARRTGYSFLSKLDISMQYYTFELDDESKELCTIATPFGLYRYKKLPMGISQAPDIAQEVMEKTLKDISDDLEVYIDDIAVFSNTFQDHMKILDTVCRRLEEKGFSVNPLKCEWAVQETDFLGHWLTPQGVKPLRKKIQGILDMQAPTDIGQLRSFLGMVTYYRDMWPRRSHILAPLTDLIGTKQFLWTEAHDKAFKAMKAQIAKDTLLSYPDHNKPFKIDTDASDYQLGGRIYQECDHPTEKNPDGTPVKIEADIGFYTRKLNSAQKNYSTIEKELLSIVETLKEFRSTLLGAEIHVYTDHKNLTYKLSQFSTQRVCRWRLLLEEYGCQFHYKSGSTNVVADALSRVPTIRSERESRGTPFVDNSTMFVDFAIDEQVSDCFLEHPTFDDEGRFPFQFKTIQEYQQNNQGLINKLTEEPERFFEKQFNDIKLICLRLKGHLKDENETNEHLNGGLKGGLKDQDKIVLTKEMLPRVVRYYHEAMAHAEGSGRLAKTIRQHFHHRDIEKECDKHMKECDRCTMARRGSRVYGEAAPRDASTSPWQEVHCDSIGPWKIELRATELTFHAMTMIDPCTNLVEIKYTLSTTAKEGAAAVENGWLSRYPRPLKIVTDNGPEFGQEFTDMCEDNGVTHRSTTSRNPQGNSLIERIHQTIGQVLRSIVHSRNPRSVHEGKAVIEETLATAMHACRCACSSSLHFHSPGALAFSRDMFLDIPLIADIIAIKRNRQLQVDKRLQRENAKRIRHEYKVGDQVWKKQYIGLSDKLLDTVTGPYLITTVHTNGTVTIQLNTLTTERINIRRILPRRRQENPLPR